jgi:hypothetical protein
MKQKNKREAFKGVKKPWGGSGRGQKFTSPLLGVAQLASKLSNTFYFLMLRSCISTNPLLRQKILLPLLLSFTSPSFFNRVLTGRPKVSKLTLQSFLKRHFGKTINLYCM